MIEQRPNRRTCPRCNGTGRAMVWFDDGVVRGEVDDECPRCNGSGEIEMAMSGMILLDGWNADAKRMLNAIMVNADLIEQVIDADASDSGITEIYTRDGRRIQCDNSIHEVRERISKERG